MAHCDVGPPSGFGALQTMWPHAAAARERSAAGRYQKCPARTNGWAALLRAISAGLRLGDKTET